MKILHLSTFDTIGGAARAGYRIHEGLRNIEVFSQMLVSKKASSDADVIESKIDANPIVRRVKGELNRLALTTYSKCIKHSFSPQWVPDRLSESIHQYNPDIIHLHWIANSYLQIESLTRFNKPIVWTLMDMWPFTGGCHYTEECDLYQKSCGACPQLGSSREQDLSRKVWNRKATAWQSINLTVVAPSTWMEQCARSSSLFTNVPIKVIPFGLDIDSYQPIEQQAARTALGLPQDKKLILFGAVSPISDYRKGFHLLQQALHTLSQSELKNDIEVVIFGTLEPIPPVDLGFKAHYLGRLQDDASLARAYSAADVMVAPSLQEAFGQTASESLACGTPAVVFRNTGLADIVDHKQTGYLATAFEADDLAKGIRWVISNDSRHRSLRAQSRHKAEKQYSLSRQAEQYAEVYRELLDSRSYPNVIAQCISQ